MTCVNSLGPELECHWHFSLRMLLTAFAGNLTVGEVSQVVLLISLC